MSTNGATNPTTIEALRGRRRQKEAPLARVRHMAAFMAAPDRWRGKPWGAVVGELTAGLDAPAVVAVLIGHLTLLEAWGAGLPPLTTLAHLPPLEDRRGWAAIELALVVIDRLDAADRRRATTQTKEANDGPA
jgi:hypothetical protein